MATVNNKVINTTKQELLSKQAVLEAKAAELREQLEAIEEDGDAGGGNWPQVGDKYYFTFINGDFSLDDWRNHALDHSRLATGNVFRTKKEAQTHATNLKIHTRLKQMGCEYGSEDGGCCGLRLSNITGGPITSFCAQHHGGVYFRTATEAHQAMNTIESEFSEAELITYLKS